MDGSGKTTLAKRVQDWIQARGYPVEFIHGHSYSVSKNSFGFSSEKVREFRLVLRMLLPLVYLDNIFTYFQKYRKITKHKVLVTDRYFYDKVIRLQFYGISNNFLAWIHLILLPRPSLTFLLNPRPIVPFKRKAEYTLQECEQFHGHYKRAGKVLNLIEIDTECSIEESWSLIAMKLKEIFH